MDNRPLNVLLQFISRLMFLKFQKEKWCDKINIGCNATENNHTFSRACDSLTFVKLKILYKISKFTYSPDNGKLNLTSLFEHA